MRIYLTSVFVSDQQRALDFYTGTLGFKPRQDEDLGEFRWLTVGNRDEPEGIELLLEPNANPIATTYQKALYAQNIPAASFQVDDLDAEYQRLQGLNVNFPQPPMDVPGARLALLDDTVGNLIQLVQLTPQT